MNWGGAACDVCGAVVHSSVLAFHLEWHEATEGLDHVDEPSIDRMQAVVSALQELPEVPARPGFVSDLRARLMADADLGPQRPRQLIPPQPLVPAGEY